MSSVDSLHVRVRIWLGCRCFGLRHECVYYYDFWVFFFQAEDGIRDLVRSRGLGDVYKRQVEDGGGALAQEVLERGEVALLGPRGDDRLDDVAAHVADRFEPEADVGTEPVSYTHLTLPTSDLV